MDEGRGEASEKGRPAWWAVALRYAFLLVFVLTAPFTWAKHTGGCAPGLRGEHSLIELVQGATPGGVVLLVALLAGVAATTFAGPWVRRFSRQVLVHTSGAVLAASLAGVLLIMANVAATGQREIRAAGLVGLSALLALAVDDLVRVALALRARLPKDLFKRR